jgi:hypothetical protein
MLRLAHRLPAVTRGAVGRCTGPRRPRLYVTRPNAGRNKSQGAGDVATSGPQVDVDRDIAAYYKMEFLKQAAAWCAAAVCTLWVFILTFFQ